jgi:hypothetical protein
LKWPGGTNLRTIVICSGEWVEKTKRKNHEETKGEKPLTISKCRLKDNIKMELREK